MSESGKGGDELSGGLQSLFRAARRAHDPSPADRARVDEAIASKLSGEVIATASAPAKPVLTRTLTVHGGMKLSIGIVCVAAASLAMMRWSQSRSVTAPAAQRALSTTSAITPPAPAPMPEEPTPHAARRAFESAPAPAPSNKLERRTRRRVQPPSPTPPFAEMRATTERKATNASSRLPPSVEDPASDVSSDATSRARSAIAASAPVSAEPGSAEQTVEVAAASAPSEAARAEATNAWRSELMLVQRMHAALRKRNFSAAAALCVEHERRWPHGEFELEREGVRAIAACGANSGEAAQRAQRYLDEHPHAPLAIRVRAACAPQLTAARVSR